MSVKPIPDGYHTVTPYLVVENASAVIDFLKKGFGAEVVQTSAMPDGTILNAEIRIGNSMVMLAEARGPQKGAPAMLYLYVPNTDAVYANAMAAGGKSLLAPVDQFYGDRNAGVTDPSGNQWWIATRIEDVSPEELVRRAATMRKG